MLTHRRAKPVKNRKIATIRTVFFIVDAAIRYLFCNKENAENIKMFV